MERSLSFTQKKISIDIMETYNSSSDKNNNLQQFATKSFGLTIKSK